MSDHGDQEELFHLEFELFATDSRGLTGSASSHVMVSKSGETDINNTGSPIALTTNPIGPGNPDINVIRDGVFPPAGTADSGLQYNTSSGAVKQEDWIGYEFPQPLMISKLIYQEGINSPDGGWFDSLNAQVRSDGIWNDVFYLNSVPPYDPNNGVNFGSILCYSPPHTAMPFD